MIPDWQTNKLYFSGRLEIDHSKSHANILNALNALQIEPLYLTDTKDVWARDYMPIQIGQDKFIEYRYDPDYLQGKRKGFRDLKTYPDIVCNRNNLPTTIKSDLLLDGGNIVKSENSIILTDKVAIENRLTKTEAINQLKRTFEVDTVVLIPWYTKEKFGHSDGVVRFINNNTVLLHEIEKNNTTLTRKLQESKLDIIWLEFEGKQNKKLNWAYINFLQMDNAILVPKLNIEEDEQALVQIQKHFKSFVDSKRVVQVEIRDLVETGGGALNCISWTIKV
jgi:agmatine/peptidylarginine deiminase